MSYKNVEGYPDPTASAAIASVTREEKSKAYRPLVYICSPFSGDIKTNTENAKRYCRFAVYSNAIPLAPHLHYPSFIREDDPAERELGLFFGLVLLGKCDELWVFGETVSTGMKAEIEKAKRKNMVVRSFTTECEEVL
jgi:hypothetical protein